MNIRELYDSVDLSFIQQCVAENTIETEILDFKEASSQSGPMQKEDKKNLSKALSGFANGNGGILIWGVKATQKNDSPDAAQELKPIQNLKRFLTDLNTLSPQLASPFLQDVKHKMILESAETNVGYAVSFIPERDNEPVMATGTDLQRYYCRVNTVFMPMSHSMVADRFNRVAKPDLRLCVQFCEARGHLGDRIFIGLANVGLGAAHYPGVSFGPRYSIPVGDTYGLENSLEMTPLVTLEVQDGQLFQAKQEIIIHPKTSLTFMRWDKNVPTDPARSIYTDFEFFAMNYYKKGFFHTTLKEAMNARPGFTFGKEASQGDIKLVPQRLDDSQFE